ncbi:MAG: radical SAM protein [Lentisphaeria bacterium]|nr:radical SAM protein [Lentisphaeria bacterium]
MRFPFNILKKQKFTEEIRNLPPDVPCAFTLEITPRCNYHCPYCYCLWHEFPAMAEKTLSLEEWKNIISILVRQKVCDFVFSGGEALLFPQLTELLIFTRRVLPSGRLVLFTNGSLLTDELLQKYNKLKIDIAVSLQGIGSYRQMTGTDHSCRKILNLLRQCRASGRPGSVSTVVTQLNRHEICDIFLAAAEAGAGFIQLGPMMVQGKGRSRKDLALSPEEWQEVKEQIRNMKNCHTPYGFCEEMICHCRKQPEEILQNFALPELPPCSAGKRSGVISPDGSYRKCLHYIDSE